MNFKAIEEYITQFSIYQYAFLHVDEIEFNDKVRTICKKEMSPLWEILVLSSGGRKRRKMQRDMSSVFTRSAVFFRGRSAGLFRYGSAFKDETGT